MTRSPKPHATSSNSVVVVDANVWLDYLLGYRKNHADSFAFIAEAIARETPLVIPSHSLKDIFYVFQQELKAANAAQGTMTAEQSSLAARAAAWSALDLIMELAAVGPSDQADAWIASKHRAVHDDYEDNLVVATCMRLDARLLVTNDSQLIRHSPVPTMSAHDATNFLRLD